MITHVKKINDLHVQCHVVDPNSSHNTEKPCVEIKGCYNNVTFHFNIGADGTYKNFYNVRDHISDLTDLIYALQWARNIVKASLPPEERTAL